MCSSLCSAFRVPRSDFRTFLALRAWNGSRPPAGEPLACGHGRPPCRSPAGVAGPVGCRGPLCAGAGPRRPAGRRAARRRRHTPARRRRAARRRPRRCPAGAPAPPRGTGRPRPRRRDGDHAAAAAATNEKLGELLVREGLITQDQLKKALLEQKNTGMRLGYNLVKLGFVEETEISKMLARQYRMPAVDLSRFEVDPKILKLLPPDVAIKHTILPLKREGRTLTVAITDPNNVTAIENIKFITRCDVFPVIAGEYTLRNAIERYYQQSDAQLQTLLKDIEAAEDLEVVEEQVDEDVRAQDLADDAPVVKLINGLLTDAVKRGASDVHFEPFEHELRVRYRVDGVLHEVMRPPIKMRAALTSRDKIMAQLNIAERRVPQDGRIKLKC